jgi:DNA replication protein DnaC
MARFLASIGMDPQDFLRNAETFNLRETVQPPCMPDIRPRLEELGWPKRALNEAERANPDRESIRALDHHGDHPGIIVLSGERGSGKTVAAAWWALRRTRGTAFVRAAEFARTSRYDDARKRWTDHHALVLDDLGAEYADAKESFVSDLDELIDIFYSDLRRLIVTTNMDGASFGARYGERIIDRLAECGRWFQLGDTSMRRETRPPWE